MAQRRTRAGGGWALLLLVAAGCADEGSPGASGAGDDFCARVLPRVDAWVAEAAAEHPVPDDPRYGGTVVVGAPAELPGGMNAFTSPDYAATQHQQHVLLMTLLRYDEALRPVPWLAESWSLSDDSLTLTFRLRGDVRWHDGEATDARDVAFTYLRATDPATGFPNPALWDRYVKGEEGVEVVDEHTVRFRLEPHADFLDPWTTLAVMPEHLLGEVAPEALAAHPFGTLCPVGNGPFVFREHREGDVWLFEANPGFPEGLGGRPFLDRYAYRIVPDANTLLSELRAGSIDVLLSPSAEQAEVILADPGLRLVRYPFRNAVFIAWNARRPALSDARVRRALTLGVDREAMVGALLGGYGTPALGRIPPFHWAHREPPAGALPHDPAAARSLLEEAGWSDRDGDGVREDASGNPLTLTLKVNTGSRQRGAAAQIVQAQLADVGVRIQVETLEWGALLEQIGGPGDRDFDGVVMAFLTNFHIDDTDLFHSSRVEEPYAWSGTASPELDATLERLQRVTDRDEALALWQEYERLLGQVQPWTFLYFPDRLDGVRDRVRDAVMDARGEWINLREWWVEEG